jgi:hypothetical protein
MFTDTVNWLPIGAEKVGADAGHDVELAESMQTVPTRTACVGGAANGIAMSDARRNIDAYNIFFKKLRFSFQNQLPFNGYNVLLILQMPQATRVS